MAKNDLGIQLLPASNEAWQGEYFCQQTNFQYSGKSVSLALLLQGSQPDAFTLRLAQNAWEQATTTAFAQRALAPEQLIEQILKAINETLEQSSGITGGGLLLLSGETIHFSTAGEIGVFLTSDGETSKVSGDETSPSRFTAVTSGPLNESDTVVVAPLFMQKFSQGVQTPAELLHQLEDHQARALWVGWQNELANSRTTAQAAKLQTSVTAILTSLQQTAMKLGQATKKLPKPALPKISLRELSWRRPSFRLGSIISLLVLLALLGGIGYGAWQIKDRIQTAKTPAAPPTTLLSRLQETPASELTTFLTTNFSFEQYQALSQADRDSFAQLLTQNTISLITPEVVQEFPEKIVSTGLAGTTFFFIDSTGQLWKYENAVLTKIQQNGLIINPTQLLAISKERVLVTDETGNIWIFDATETQPVSLPLPKELATGKKRLASYLKNLYIYAETGRTIYRVGGYDRDIINLSSYAKLDSLAIADLTDFKIFGDAVSVSSAGSVQFFRRNQPLGAAIVSSLNPVTSLAVNEAGTEITLSANRFVTSYKSTGELVTQRFLTVEEPITQVLLENNLPKYLLTSKKLYKLP